MDQHRDLAMREYLDRLAADKATAFRSCCIDDRLVEMLMLDMDDFANDTCQL